MAFIPKFQTETDIAVVADMINLPHEDYPRRVSSTESMIRILIKQIESRDRPNSFHAFDIKTIHGVIMSDLPSKYRGTWRTVNVMVGPHSPPPPYLIESEITESGIFPVNIKSDLVEWYRKFQVIHPFYDGNGRVGGIVVAVLSYFQNDGKMLAPLQ